MEEKTELSSIFSKSTLKRVLPKRMIAFTDGSYKDEKAGIAYLYKIENDYIEYTSGFAKLNNEKYDEMYSDVAEMEAIIQIIKIAKLNDVSELIILTDSQNAIRNFGKKYKKEKNKTLKRFKEITTKISKDIHIALFYIPSHSNILGNEHCDKLAKQSIIDELNKAFLFNLKKYNPIKIVYGVDEEGELIVEEVKKYPSKKEAINLLKNVELLSDKIT